MKKLVAALLLSAAAGTAFAGTFVYTPSDADLNDLDHSKVYTWGILDTEWASLISALNAGETITSAQLVFDNIYNWQKEENKLFIHLLDNPKKGFAEFTDPTGSLSDYFTEQYTVKGKKKSTPILRYTGTNILLDTWTDLDGPKTTDDLTISFSEEEIATLVAYLGSATTTQSTAGFGFDPDCHFYNCGVSFIVTTEKPSVPDTGASLLLLGTALTAIAGLRRFLRA